MQGKRSRPRRNPGDRLPSSHCFPPLPGQRPPLPPLGDQFIEYLTPFPSLEQNSSRFLSFSVALVSP